MAAAGTGRKGRDNLKQAIAYARGSLDADFRRGDYLQASLDAANVSKLAYALYYITSNETGTPEEGGQDARTNETEETDETETPPG